MKNLLSLLLVLTAVNLSAQTNAPVTNSTTFFNQALTWMSSFDTNSTTFIGDKLNISAGADTVNNQNMAMSFTLEAELGSVFNQTNAFLNSLSLESITRNATVGGTIVSEQGGLGWNFTKYDVRLTGYLDLGYKFDTHQTYIAPGLRLKKSLASKTYLWVTIEQPIYLMHRQPGGFAPTFGTGPGFVF